MFTVNELAFLFAGNGLEVTEIAGGYDGRTFDSTAERILVMGRKR
jgi:hypothetical protein